MSESEYEMHRVYSRIVSEWVPPAPRLSSLVLIGLVQILVGLFGDPLFASPEHGAGFAAAGTAAIVVAAWVKTIALLTSEGGH